MNDDEEVIEPDMFRRLDLTNGHHLVFAPSQKIPEGKALVVSGDFPTAELVELSKVLSGETSVVFVMNDIEAEAIVEKIETGQLRPLTQH